MPACTARLAFRDQVTDEFGADADVTFHLQPPVASRMGLQRKIPLPSRTAGAVFWGLTKLAKLRGHEVRPVRAVRANAATNAA